MPHADEGVVVRLGRLSSGVDGSPRFVITLDSGSSYTTVADEFIGWQLQTREFAGAAVRLLIKRVDRSFRVYDISII